MEEVVFIKNRKGLNMAIKLNYSPERTKCVFLEHGLGARKEYPHMKVLEDLFARHGYNVVNIDACDSNNASEKSDTGITFTGHYQDLEDVIEWAKTKKFYKEPFALAGQSLGAQAVVMYAGNYPEKVNLLVPVAFCWIDGKTESLNNSRRKAIEEQGFFEQVSKSTGQSIFIKMDYLNDLEQHNMERYIGEIKADTYVLAGSLDKQYHIENSKALFDMLNCNKEFVLLEDVPHDLANTPETKAIFEDALQRILDENAR